MIDTNGLNAALTALIRPIVLEIVKRELANFEHLNSRVYEAHRNLDIHHKLLANLETAVETLGKRVNATPIPSDPSDLNSAIDRRLIEVTTRTNANTYPAQQALLEFVQASVNESTEDLVPRHTLEAYVEGQLDHLLEGENLVDVIKDVIEETVESKEERIRRVVREVVRDELTVTINVN